MSDMVRAWLDHTQQLDQEATPGPWYEFETGVGSRAIPDDEAVFEDRYMCRGSREWIARSRTALPQAAAAIRAVLDLHQPERWEWNDSIVCTICGPEEQPERWPCQTVQAVQSALCDHKVRGITWAEQGTTAYACATCEHEWTETQ